MLNCRLDTVKLELTLATESVTLKLISVCIRVTV